MVVKEEAIIAYLGPIYFPNNGAASRRVLGNLNAIRECGYKVIMGAGQVSKTSETSVFNYRDIEVHALNERTADNFPSIIKNIIYLAIGRKTIKWLDSMVQKPAAIILYDGYSPYFLRLLPWCRKHNIPLIYDAVEWYEPNNIIQRYLSPRQLNVEWAMRKLSIYAKNIISISTYLDRYYKSKNCNSIIIPPLVDVKEFEPNLNIAPNNRLSIAYTGYPGHKDLFDNYLEAILRVDPLGERFVLRIAGLTNEELLRYPALRKRKYQSLPPCIHSIGIVKHNDAIELVKTSDFSVLLRKINRVSKAGFPTKVVESLTVGTPVICNLTSDLNIYIHDGVEGIVCKDHNVESLAAAMEKAFELTSEEKTLMRVNARKQAEKYFDYRNYIVLFADFIKTILIKN